MVAANQVTFQSDAAKLTKGFVMSLTTPLDTPLRADPRKVFVIYGRNTAAREQMKLFLRALGLTPIWVRDVRDHMGGTAHVIDVVARGMKEAQAVLALVTPDEFASLHHELREAGETGEAVERWQARPNVLFEAGIAFGRDRERVAFVVFGDAKLFSDVAGVHIFQPTNDSGPDSQRAQLRDLFGNGLKCAINASHDWMTAGDFDKVLTAANAMTSASTSRTAAGRWSSQAWRGITNRGILMAAIFILAALLFEREMKARDNPWSYLATQSILAGGASLSAGEIGRLLDPQTKEVIIVGQNLQTLLKNGLLRPVRALLDNGVDRVTFVVTIPEFYDTLAEQDDVRKKNYLKELATSVKTLDDFKSSLNAIQNPRVIILAHPGASSLSAIIRDRGSNERGVIVFTAKWATDAQPDHRLYGVIDRKTHGELFRVLDGYVPELIKPNVTMELPQLIEILKKRCEASQIKWADLRDLN